MLGRQHGLGLVAKHVTIWPDCTLTLRVPTFVQIFKGATNMFRLQFKTDNAAFEDSQEIGDILRSIASKIDNGQTSGYVRDSNGNNIGEWGII